jgi:hypothetical protein
MREEEGLVALVLPMETEMSTKVMKALAEVWPGLVVRDSEHSGRHVKAGHGARATMELILNGAGREREEKPKEERERREGKRARYRKGQL